MVRPAPPPLRDPEFDRTPGPVLVTPPESLQFYQRLVVNPFLAIFVLGLLSASTRLPVPFLRDPHPILIMGCIAVLIFLIHYHCLDCGHTGWYFNWKVHACHAVTQRFRNGKVVRGFHPIPSAQLWLWGILVILSLLIISPLVANQTSWR